MNQELLRRVPQLEKLLQAVADCDAVPRPVVVRLARAQVVRLRQEAQSGRMIPDFPEIVAALRSELEAFSRSRLQPVINATGVLLHTNLGRAPLSAAVARILTEVAVQYSNLEFDLDTGDRGRRGGFVELLLATLCEAEAATVVNNCAAALVLILRHLATGTRNEVIISRGQLVEIGGGFRVPEILETSGARLREVGSTNKTTLQDYARAITPQTALILRVHRSNFYMEGFVAEPAIEDLAALGKAQGIPVVEDLGSGAVVATESLGTLDHEPTPAEILARGVDLVCCSGDKLLGGPQAGIIAGRAGLLSGLKKDPFFRALRSDKLILGALQETALACLEAGDSRPDLPLLHLLHMKPEAMHPRAVLLAAALQGCSVRATVGQSLSRCGGGTMPKASLPSITVDLAPLHGSVDALAARLRRGSPPVIGFVENNRLRLDLRTVLPGQDATLTEAVRRAAAPEMDT